MELAILVLLVFTILVVLSLVLVTVRRRREEEETLRTRYDSLRHELSDALTTNLNLVNQQLSQVTTLVTEQLKGVTQQIQSSTGQINQRMDNASRVVGEVREGLGDLRRATQQVLEMGKDIMELQEILRVPKLRGGFGEFLLGDILSQILPSRHYELQYTFRDSSRVDAVIKLKDRLVPVDAKFPLENFRRLMECQDEKERKIARRRFVSDVKRHIDTIASSYINPEEGTLNFALMYIPAENVYYEVILRDDMNGEDRSGIMSYAFSRRVIPVSPNSFYAYLQTILLGLRGLEISRKAKEILARIERLRDDFARLMGDFDVLGKHINNARTKYEDTQKRMERFSERMRGLSGIGEAVLEESGEKVLKE